MPKVWSIDLPRLRAGETLDEFLRTTSNGKLDACGCSKSSSLFTPSPLERMLLDIRFFVGRFFDRDHEPAATKKPDSYSDFGLMQRFRHENRRAGFLLQRVAHKAGSLIRS
jgi:hypothetical protein